MKYLCFLAYLLINLVNCRFFVTSDYSLQKQVQYILFLFLCSRFHKAEITSRRSLYYVGTYLLLRRDVSFAASGRSKCYIGTHFLLHRNVFYQLTQVVQSANASSSISWLKWLNQLTQISRQAEGYVSISLRSRIRNPTESYP